MDRRRTFTNDPNYFPTPKLREIVDFLHSHQQKYSMLSDLHTLAHWFMNFCKVLMVDPAVAFLENQNYSTFDRGLAAGAYLKNPNGTVFKGLVWPGKEHYSYNATSLKYVP